MLADLFLIEVLQTSIPRIMKSIMTSMISALDIVESQ